MMLFLFNVQLRYKYDDDDDDYLIGHLCGVASHSAHCWGPILFIICINDLAEHCHCGSDLYLYADDAKLFFIKCPEDSLALQKDLDNLTQWVDIWLLRLNIGKCKAVSYGRRRPEICINYNISDEIIEKN